LFFLSRDALVLVKDLHKLAFLVKEESLLSKRDLNKEFKLNKKSLNLKFNNFVLDTFLEKRDLHKRKEEDVNNLEDSSTILGSLNSISMSSSSASTSLPRISRQRPTQSSSGLRHHTTKNLGKRGQP
jgi:hypothetical protein